jgi:hypothetical protein
MASTLDRLHKKTRRVVERNLPGGEDIIAVIAGRSKQAMIVTDRRLLIVKAGVMAGGFRARAAEFGFEEVAAINVHTGPGIAALEVVIAGPKRSSKPNLRAAYQLPNWLPCHPPVGDSPLIAELRTYVQSGGRSRSARYALGDF